MGIFQNATPPADTGVYIYRYSATPEEPPSKLKLENFPNAPKDFHPLGIEYDSSTQILYVVNHAESGPQLDLFRLNSQRGVASWLTTIQHPRLHAPNAIAIVSPTELLVSNDHRFRKRHSPVLSTIESYAGLPLGDVVRVSFSIAEGRALLQHEMTVTTLAKVPFANGILLLNKTHLAVASTSSAAIYVYESKSGFAGHGFKNGRPSLVTKVILPFLPDNLSAGPNNGLLVAGHGHPPSLEKVARNNARCQLMTKDEDCQARAPSFVASWSESSGLRVLYADDAFQSASTAVWDASGAGFGIVAGLYERGIMTFSQVSPA